MPSGMCRLEGCQKKAKPGCKYCCVNHQKMRVVLDRLGIDYNEWLKRRKVQYKCRTCGELKYLEDFIDDRKPLSTRKTHRNCKACRSDGSFRIKMAEELRNKERKDRPPASIKYFGRDGATYIKMLSGNLGVECFDPRMIWEPSPSGVTG